ncbi:hypothetical protein P9738_13150 [Bacillus siamensis]|uniref:hypothetical protein n=1 Tax=Bacillus siamensis TaxID=659243 RepID=UPI002E1E7540|nr:hypothetical protein [Bacillus siamensis]MED5097147.1 hypothetical protein [Bacillus siamensis]
METKKYVRIKKASVDGVWYADKIGQIFEVERLNSVSVLTNRGVHGESSVLVEDVEFIFTENRKAAVGERVLITKTVSASGTYNVGDIFTVQTADEYGGIFVKEHLAFLIRPEYEVIIENEEADEMKIDLNAMGYDELMAHGDAVMEAIKKRTFQEGFRAAKQVQRKLAKMNAEKSAQARRDEIVEQAKADLENLADEDGPVYQTEDNEGYPCSCYASFRVNKEHRTVACDLRGVRTGERYKRGIAKAAPDDCFNVHIGKAIALRRALGLAVPILERSTAD